MSESVLSGVAGGVGAIVLNVPDRLNAVDAPMLDLLVATIARLEADPAVRVLTLTGRGRGFCAGADLSSGDAAATQVDTATLYAAGAVTRALLRSAKPVVACVNGVAAGVGVSFALACDYVLATESASFVLAFTKVGLMPDGGATALVAASIGRARAMRMALTAEKVPAGVAAQWGLIAEAVPDADFASRREALLTSLVAGAPLAFARTKSAVNAATVDLDASLAREEEGQEGLLRSNDFSEGVRAFLTKEAPRFRGE